MNTAQDDAQRELEQQALRNVRGLVDRIEALETTERRSERKLLLALLVVGLLMAIGAVVYMGRKEALPAPVVDPARLPPIKAGPPK
jgi:hypothetical protein